MRIPESGHTPLHAQATVTPQPAGSPVPSVPLSSSADVLPASLSERLTTLFAELGLEISPNLAAQITATGITPAELDREGALRALFLHNNSIPLTAALLKTAISPEAPVLFHQAAALHEEALTLLGNGNLAAETRAAVETLARDMESLLWGNVIGYNLPGGSLRDRRNESPVSMSPARDEPWGLETCPDGFAKMIRKSGMAFEWRLLAWYRAGRDPGSLENLLHGDLKGMLFLFLRDRGQSSGRDPVTGKLEEHARSLLDAITSRQINHLLDGSGEQRTIPLIIPVEDPRERMYAGVRPESGKSGDGEAGPERFSLTLDVETSKMGTVCARLRFSGAMTSVTFLLKDRHALTLAEGMADEFRSMLRERGYEPGVIHFMLADRAASYPSGPDSHNSLNIRG